VKEPADIQDRINAAVLPLQKQITEFQEREQQQKEALARAAVQKNLGDVALKAGVRESAIQDFLARGSNVFNLEGKAMNGDTPLFSQKNPADPLGMEEWAGQLLSEAPHLFKDSKGGGASNQSGSEGGGSHLRRISDDPVEFGKNLEGIAKGEVAVVKS
jgi:hypothetical protein